MKVNEHTFTGEYYPSSDNIDIKINLVSPPFSKIKSFWSNYAPEPHNSYAIFFFYRIFILCKRLITESQEFLIEK